eukprot:scaffold1509_cov240-Pinguiococcus_pyrenoidosus.AAC.39
MANLGGNHTVRGGWILDTGDWGLEIGDWRLEELFVTGVEHGTPSHDSSHLLHQMVPVKFGRQLDVQRPTHTHDGHAHVVLASSAPLQDVRLASLHDVDDALEG